MARGGGMFHDRDLIEGSKIRLYDFASGQLKAVLKGHRDAVSGLAFSPDGKKLISGSADKSAIVWDIETQTLLHRLEGHRGPIYAVGFTPDGQRAVTGSVDKTLRLWKVADGALIKEMTGHGDKVRSLAVSPSDGSIASCDWSGEIRYWDGKTGAPGEGAGLSKAAPCGLAALLAGWTPAAFDLRQRGLQCNPARL